jgi:hypothetical protein
MVMKIYLEVVMIRLKLKINKAMKHIKKHIYTTINDVVYIIKDNLLVLAYPSKTVKK